jgi:hypothetical protein
MVSRSAGRPRVSENTVARIFGQKKDVKERKKLYNEEIDYLQSMYFTQQCSDY